MAILKKEEEINFAVVVLYAVQRTAYFQLVEPHKELSTIANTLWKRLLMQEVKGRPKTADTLYFS